MGKAVVSENDFNTSNGEIQLNLSELSEGIYFLKITANNQSIIKRIIKN